MSKCKKIFLCFLSGAAFCIIIYYAVLYSLPLFINLNDFKQNIFESTSTLIQKSIPFSNLSSYKRAPFFGSLGSKKKTSNFVSRHFQKAEILNGESKREVRHYERRVQAALERVANRISWESLSEF